MSLDSRSKANGGPGRVRGNKRSYNPHEFLAVDGEGLSSADGEQQRYILMALSNGQTLYNPRGLTTKEIFEFLFSQKVRTFWTFSGTYDVNMWLEGLGEEALRRLADPTKRNSVYWGEYRIMHYYGKLFQVTRREGKKGRTIRVWDMFPYVQCSFAKMLKDWDVAHTPVEIEEVAEIVRMKKLRREFSSDQIDEMTNYCLLEMKYLSRAVNMLITLSEKSGYLPTQWHSPAAIAKIAMRKHGVLAHKGDVPAAVLEAAEKAYHGGRAEITRMGLIKGPIWRYDIHSAYPAVCVTLPSWAGGTWEHVKDIALEEAVSHIALLCVSWKRPPAADKERYVLSKDFGPFPVRLQVGTKRYPYQGAGWYWSTEVKAAMRLSDITVHEAWIFRPKTQEKPFSYIADLYVARAAMKAKESYDPQEKVLKLIMNSTYGSLAQHQIPGMGESEYRDLLWAGLITAGTRAKLLDAYKPGVIGFATDGIISTVPLDVPLSDALGDWEAEDVLDWIFLVQSGIYFFPAGKDISVKTRGIPQSYVNPQMVIDAWLRHESAFDIKNMGSVPRRFIGYRTALHSIGKLAVWRTWRPLEKVIKFTLAPRRKVLGRRGDVLYTRPPDIALEEIGDMLLVELTGVNDFEEGHSEEKVALLEQPDFPDLEADDG
jgi:hypothetical protein